MKLFSSNPITTLNIIKYNKTITQAPRWHTKLLLYKIEQAIISIYILYIISILLDLIITIAKIIS